MSHFSEEDIVIKIAILLNRPYREVTQECQAICAMSRDPSSRTLPFIYAQASSGKTLAQIQDDFAHGRFPVEAVLRWTGIEPER